MSDTNLPVGKKLFQVTVEPKTDAKGDAEKHAIAVREKTADEIAEEILLTAPMPTAEKLTAIVNKASNEVLAKMNASMRNLLLRALGFEKDPWNHDLIRSTGAGGVLVAEVTERAKEFLKSLDVEGAFALTEKEKLIINEDAHERFRWEFQRALRSEIDRAAKDAAVVVAETAKNEMNKQLVIRVQNKVIEKITAAAKNKNKAKK